MNYRIATSEEFPRLAELRWKFRRESGEEPLMEKADFVSRCTDFLKTASENGFHTFWIAESSDEIVGNLFVHRIDLIPRPCQFQDAFGYVTNNFVIPSHRGRGIGKALLAKVRE